MSDQFFIHVTNAALVHQHLRIHIWLFIILLIWARFQHMTQSLCFKILKFHRVWNIIRLIAILANQISISQFAQNSVQGFRLSKVLQSLKFLLLLCLKVLLSSWVFLQVPHKLTNLPTWIANWFLFIYCVRFLCGNQRHVILRTARVVIVVWLHFSLLL